MGVVELPATVPLLNLVDVAQADPYRRRQPVGKAPVDSVLVKNVGVTVYGLPELKEDFIEQV